MIQSQNRINKLNECVKNHVDDVSIWLNSCELRSTEFGCGVFATRDIEPNELLFGDKPLLLGPTGNKFEPIVCVMCYEKIKDDLSSHLCPNKCALVLCGESGCAAQHIDECQLLQKWKPKNPTELSFKKLKGLLVIRSLFLSKDQRTFFNLMQKNYLSIENDLYFNNEFEHFPQDKETNDALRAALAAINTNAFKILYRIDRSGDVGISGFYPIMSLINHKCSPNTRHDIDRKFVGRLFAARPIKNGEQIFMTYSQLLWGTSSRRMHLMFSKHFRCMCDRCIDSTEYSTNLSAIRCSDRSCIGLVLPIDPINLKSNGKCNCCGQTCESRRFFQIHEMAASMTKHFINGNFTLSDINHFIENRLFKLVPKSNQFVVEMKLKAIWKCAANSYDGWAKLFTAKAQA